MLTSTFSIQLCLLKLSYSNSQLVPHMTHTSAPLQNQLLNAVGELVAVHSENHMQPRLHSFNTKTNRTYSSQCALNCNVHWPFSDKIVLLHHIGSCNMFYRGLNRNVIRRPKYFPLRSVIFTLRLKWNEGRKRACRLLIRLWFI